MDAVVIGSGPNGLVAAATLARRGWRVLVVEAQPRPGYEALRTLKRGMTSDEVARLVGQPISSDTLPGGNVVWDYGYGRTITFDTRGRTTSLSGFPAP